MTDKGIIYSAYINSSYNSTSNKQPNQKWAELNRHFSKEDSQMAKRHMKRCSVITHHQGNANQNHNETSPQTGWMATTIKNTNNKCWQGWEEKGILQCYWWECTLVQPPWKRVWEFLKELKRSTTWSSSSTSGLYPGRKKQNSNLERYMHSDIHRSIICDCQGAEAT